MGWTDDVRSALDSFDISVVPSSDIEPYSFAKMEAMLRGLPTVILDNGGEHERLVDAIDAVLVPDNDSGIMAQRLGWLMRNYDARRRIASTGWAKAARLFNQERMMDEIENVYRGVVDGEMVA